MRTPIILATLAVAHSSLAAPLGPFDSPVINSPNPADDPRSPFIAPSPLPELASPVVRASPALRTAGRRRSIPRYKRIVTPNAPSAPIDTPQGPSFGMGLGIPSITNAVPGTPLPLPDFLPVEPVGEVIDSPTEELPSAPFDALLPNTPGVTAPSVPQTPDLPVKPPVPDTSSLPLPDDDLMKLLADEDNIVSAMTQDAMAAASEGAPVDPYALINRLEQFKAANERMESSFGFIPAPIQGATGALPVRRQAPALIDLLSTLKALVESGQLDHMSPAQTPDQLAPPNSPLAYALNVPSTLVTGPPESIPTEMLDVSAVPFPPPTSPAVVASSVPIAHDDPTMVTSALPLSRLPAAPTPSLDAPFSSENDSGEPFAAAVLAPGWEWSETTGVERPAPNPPSLPTPSLMGARDFKPTAPIGQLSNKELPPLLAAPKEKRASKLRLSADR